MVDLLVQVLPTACHLELDQRRSVRTNRIFVHLEHSLADWRRAYEILVCPFEMFAEKRASFHIVRFGSGLAQIVAHPPKDVQASDVDHGGVIGNVKESKELFRGRELG